MLHQSTHHPDFSAPVIDWSKTPLSKDYAGHYVKIIDDVFTPEECSSLIALAESNAEWIQAAVNYGMGPSEHFIDTEYRHSERILRFDRPAADRLYERLLPYVPELVEINKESEWKGIMGSMGPVTGTWRLVGVNERLSFLRYGKGNYFRGHCDSELDLPDGRMSRVTIQIYLGEDIIEGGATRITGYGDNYIDVQPRKGRVLIFQQRGIFHSGEEVVMGVKYAMRSDFMFRHFEDDST